MPKITKKVLGGASGKAGNIVFRQMNGETFFSTRPEHYKPTKSGKLKTARKNFAVVTAFAKVVNSVPELKEIWLNAKMKGKLSFNRIMKVNRNAAVNGSLTTSNKITPDGLLFSLSSLSIQGDELNLSFNFPGEYNVQFPLTLFIFFSFNSDNDLFFQRENIDSPAPDNIYVLSVKLNSLINGALQNDPFPIVYLAVAGLPDNKNIYWSLTLAKQLQ